MMNVLYSSPHYCVAEYSGRGGIELVDKQVGRSAYLEGALEAKFRSNMATLFSEQPSEESVDEYLGYYEALLTNPVVLH